MKITTVFLGITAMLACFSCADNTPAPAAKITGVWANADCELLRTDRFALLFERHDSVLTATLHCMDQGDTMLLGKTAFSRDSVLLQYVGKANEVQQPADLGTLQADGKLRVAVNGREQLLEKIEAIDIVEPYDMPQGSALEIGDCVQNWCLGTKGGVGRGQIYFEAGTNRHSFTFNIQQGMIYCRAARIRYNDHGALFAQNIRMMANAREQTCEMPDDNRAVSAAKLVVDNSKFQPDQCVFSDEGIYWSFIRFEGEKALLNGCGEVYEFGRPGKGNLIEWVAFEKQ